MPDSPTSRKRADGQMSGLAGEFFVAAELLKRGLQTSVTFGSAKSIDLFAHNALLNHTFCIQVKALRSVGYFKLSHAAVNPNLVYVFVLLNDPDHHVTYYIVPGSILATQPQRFPGIQDSSVPGVHPKHLERFKEGWSHFQTRPTPLEQGSKSTAAV